MPQEKEETLTDDLHLPRRYWFLKGTARRPGSAIREEIVQHVWGATDTWARDNATHLITHESLGGPWEDVRWDTCETVGDTVAPGDPERLRTATIARATIQVTCASDDFPWSDEDAAADLSADIAEQIGLGLYAIEVNLQQRHPGLKLVLTQTGLDD